MPGTSVFDGLALGIDADGVVLDVVLPPGVVLPADAPDEPAVALALLLPLPLEAVLPGVVVTEPPADVPGVALAIVPPLPAEVPALPESCIAACWLQASKSVWVCAPAGAAISATATAVSESARVKVAMNIGPPGRRTRLQAKCH
jgi:hypothetical protein